MRKGFLAFAAIALAFSGASAQTNISGDISGTVTDASGAVVPNATVTVTNKGTGEVKTAKSNATGSYRVSLLPPGAYHVVVTESGFQTSSSDVSVSAGQVQAADAKLNVGNSSTTVEVTSEAPLLQTENGEISTSFDQEQVQTLPNPGNDLTFIAQTAPGAVMNTQGGYGNFSTFGLPATANTFTINGGYENDPFLNLNNSGASNLLLGNNDIGDVTVVSNAYGAQYGGLGGTQVNEISRSGTNQFHGDATYWWNGSALNANDYFNDQVGTKKSRSNANQWAGAIGGPIFKDRTFFFFDTEGLRVIVPVRGTVYAPNAAYIATTENNAAAQGAGAVSFYQGFFNEYTKNAAYATATAEPNDPNAVEFNAQSANFAHEQLFTGRIDQKISDKDQFFAHMKYDFGVQPTFTSILDPIFNAASPQPDWEGQLNETHTFTPNLTNQFVFSAIYYRAIFQNTNQAAANAIAPFTISFTSGDFANDSSFGTPGETPGGEDAEWPQGRAVTGYQFADDLTFTRGRHTIRTGFYMRRDDVTDYGPSVYTTPSVSASEATFAAGSVDQFTQNFPTRPTQPVALYNLGAYIQDDWAVTPALKVTAGIRFEHNSNPVCQSSCFSRLANDFASLPTSPTTPYSNATGNGLIDSGQYKAYASFQEVGYEPRISFAWSPRGQGSNTVVRGGFGLFADAFPGQIADSLLNNAPTNVGFTLTNPNPATPIIPLYSGAAGSYTQLAAASNNAFQTGFRNGGSFSTLSSAVSGFGAPSFTSTTNTLSYPIYEEFNLELEQGFAGNIVVKADYVGNHSYHQPVNDFSANAYNAGGAPGFPTLPTSAPNPNFSSVNQVCSGASSNYNGLVVTATKRSKLLTLQANYTYSHALDEVSNGGFNYFQPLNSVNPENPSPSLLRQNYGNSDYDIRHYFSGNYIFNLPYFGGPHILTDGWQAAGTVFHSTGLPFTYYDSNTAGDLANYINPGVTPGVNLFARQLVPQLPKKCSGGNVLNLGTSAGTPCSSALDVGLATDFGQQERNQVFGPSYTDSDIAVNKAFPLYFRESAKLILGVQLFNMFNHPNFAQPNHDVASCVNATTGVFNCANSTLGTISTTVNPPTSILGSFLGGDASPRLVQLKAKIQF